MSEKAGLSGCNWHGQENLDVLVSLFFSLSLNTLQSPAHLLEEGVNDSMKPVAVSGNKSMFTSPDSWLAPRTIAPSLRDLHCDVSPPLQTQRSPTGNHPVHNIFMSSQTSVNSMSWFFSCPIAHSYVGWMLALMVFCFNHRNHLWLAFLYLGSLPSHPSPITLPVCYLYNAEWRKDATLLKIQRLAVKHSLKFFVHWTNKHRIPVYFFAGCRVFTGSNTTDTSP